MLIDLERRQPVALLPDRTADTVAQWLRAHPGGEGIARERSTADAEGARQGAPTAPQVADRFHLLQNLRVALDQVCSMPGHVRDAGNETRRQQPVSRPDGAIAVPGPSHALPLPAQQRAAQRQAHRQARHPPVWPLPRQGWTAPAMAPQVGRSLRTGQRDLRLATCAGRTRRRALGARGLNPYQPYLLERWNAGGDTAMRLCRALQHRGYSGSDGRVAASARRWRQAPGLAPGQRRPRQALPHGAEPGCQPLTPRRASWLARRRETKCTAAEAQQLPQLRAQQGELPEAMALAQECAALVRQQQPEALDPWRKRALTSPLEALQRFATGLSEAYAAGKAGVTLPGSSRPVEGPIHRRKMLKRQMFGRARLDLLRCRFLLAPRRTQQPRQRLQAPAEAQGQPAAA